MKQAWWTAAIFAGLALGAVSHVAHAQQQEEEEESMRERGQRASPSDRFCIRETGSRITGNGLAAAEARPRDRRRPRPHPRGHRPDRLGRHQGRASPVGPLGVLTVAQLRPRTPGPGRAFFCAFAMQNSL